MRSPTTHLAVLIAATGLTLAAPARAGEAHRPDAAPNPAMLSQPREAGSDILAGRGPNPHAREIRAIAVYEAIGNRAGAEMLAGDLHEFGITRREIDHSVARAKVHATSRDEREPGY
jgi:hypothetical protein